MKREGTHIGAETTAARYDGRGVLRISGRLKLVYDATARAVTSQATALNATVTGAMTGAFAVWLGHEK
jgi:hypothetical protein